MRYIAAKSIIGTYNNVNLYRGCTHGCIYCDARSDCYNVGTFEDIAVKENAIETFTKQIKSKRKKCMINTGSMCDPYLPIEKDLRLTRQMLEIIRDNYFGVGILTKSTLLLRDIDLIEEINKRYRALVCMTITTFDDNLCKMIERNVSVTSERFKCLQEFGKRNIPIGIWLCPILPFINDTEENIINIVNKCIEIGVKYIICFDFGTTKRSGSEEYFYKCLDLYFPGMKSKYQRYYRNQYSCSSPNSNKLWKIFKKMCDDNNIIYDINKVNEIFNKPLFEQISLFDKTTS